jgi:hypothetical protein
MIYAIIKIRFSRNYEKFEAIFVIIFSPFSVQCFQEAYTPSLLNKTDSDLDDTVQMHSPVMGLCQ